MTRLRLGKQCLAPGRCVTAARYGPPRTPFRSGNISPTIFMIRSRSAESGVCGMMAISSTSPVAASRSNCFLAMRRADDHVLIVFIILFDLPGDLHRGRIELEGELAFEHP